MALPKYVLQETHLECTNRACKYNSHTHEFATILETRLKEDQAAIQTTIMNIGGNLTITQRPLDDGDMNHRRNNCYHLMSCEGCGTVQSICVYQHKGITIIDNKFPLSIPDIPGLKLENERCAYGYTYWGYSICQDGYSGPEESGSETESEVS